MNDEIVINVTVMKNQVAVQKNSVLEEVYNV
jgi:hypothetical protein